MVAAIIDAAISSSFIVYGLKILSISPIQCLFSRTLNLCYLDTKGALMKIYL